MQAAPANAWIVLAAWLGLMGGIGAALRPEVPVPLSHARSEAQADEWRRVFASDPVDVPALWIGEAACGCDAQVVAALSDWAGDAGLSVRAAPGMAGIALTDANGILRYAGDPAALRSHCGGRRGFRAWWSGPASPAVLTAPCPCT